MCEVGGDPEQPAGDNINTSFQLINNNYNTNGMSLSRFLLSSTFVLHGSKFMFRRDALYDFHVDPKSKSASFDRVQRALKRMDMPIRIQTPVPNEEDTDTHVPIIHHRYGLYEIAFNGIDNVAYVVSVCESRDCE